jgi:hypothetical protein
LKKCENVTGKFAPQSNCQGFYPLQNTRNMYPRPHTSYGISNKVPPTYDSQKGFLPSAQSAESPICGGISPRTQACQESGLRRRLPNPSEPPAMPRFNKCIVEQSPPLQVSFTEPEPTLAKVLKLPDGPENPGKNRSQSKQKLDSLRPTTWTM